MKVLMNTPRPLLALIILFMLNVGFAASSYEMIVDAGSSGSRLHLFKYNDTKTLPYIEDVFTVKNKIPITSFLDNPSKAAMSLKDLFDTAVNEICKNNIKKPVAISIYGTGGMRLADVDKQQAIYGSIRDFLNDKYSKVFSIKNLDTITGKQEAIYAWLEVNYYSKTFHNKTTTLGAIDVGGASTQIAFEVPRNTIIDPQNESMLTINDKQYIVFAKSFLGLGYNQARETINKMDKAVHCYADEAPYQGSYKGLYNFKLCDHLYGQLIATFEVAQKVLPIPVNTQLVVFSGAYKTYHFFKIDKGLPDSKTIINQIINPLCSKKWEFWKKEFPKESPEKLIAYCANGIYITHLLFDTYLLENKQIMVAEEIADNEIDWTLGAVLFFLSTK